MKRDPFGGVLLVAAIMLLPCFSGGDEPSLPSGEVVMSTDKACYYPGEYVNITATGWAGVPSIGDFPINFWAITNEAEDPVFETANLLLATGGFMGTLNGTWNQTYRFPYGQPPSGEQVPPGRYTILFYEIPRPNETVPGWIPTEIEIGECGGRVIADAGPDQTVYEGEVVQFNGSASQGVGNAVFPIGPNMKVNDGNDTQGVAGVPQVALDDNGTAFVVWPIARVGGFGVYFDKAPRQGQFGKDVRVDDTPPPDGTGGHSDIAIGPDGEIHVVWWVPGIRYSSSTDGGVTFSPSIAIDDVNHPAGYPVRVDTGTDGSVHVVWRAVDLSGVYYRSSPDGGTSWDSVFRVSDGAFPDVAAVDNSSAYVVWAGKVMGSNETGISFSRKGPNGSFEPPIRVHPLADRHRLDPSIALLPSGEIFVTWVEYGADDYTIALVRSLDGGSSFEPPIIVRYVKPQNNPHMVRLDEPAVTGFGSEGVVVAWVEYTKPFGCGTEARVSVSMDKGMTFGPHYRVDDDPNRCGKREIAIAGNDHGDLFAAWHDSRHYPYGGIAGSIAYGVWLGVSSVPSLTFEWDFDADVDSDGDGNYTNDVDATGPTPTYTYYDDGVYAVTLTATDESGLSDSDTCSIIVLPSDIPPVADAGPDQVVYEGDIVSFNGTGSHGSSVGLWEDSFEDDSRISQMMNTTVSNESIVLTNISLSIMHTFDTDPGFVIEDDMPNTVIWWDSAKEAIRWFTDREDPRDHYEKLVSYLPFPITDAMDISARVDYMYWRADTYAVADPLILQKNGSWRLGSKHGPANNTLIVRVYGGDPDYGDLDRMAGFFFDDSSTAHIVYLTDYDKHYWELITTRMTWDSDARTMHGEVRDQLGNIVVSDSELIDEGFTFHKYGIGSYGEGYIDGNPHIGEGLADNISISVFGYRTPGWVTSEVISPSGVLQSWGELDVSAVEPDRTEMEVQVLDEFGSPIVTGISPNDCPLSLDGLVDPILYPRIMLKAILTTERNETPSLLSWNVSSSLEESLSYYWDMNDLVDSDGDGDYTNDVDATGPTPTHVYYDDGICVVTLKVTDASGLSDWDTCNITVLNVPPIPEWTSRSSDGTILNPPYPEGKEILFEATVCDPGIYDTFTYDWDFGDGTVLLDAGPSVTHTYGDDDIYIVVLTVTDDDGGVGIDDTPPLETTNENPVASIDMPFCIFSEGTSPCEAIGQFTDPGWLDTHSAVWDYGDGTYENAVLTGENDPPDATGMNITSHIYGDDGTYAITFTVLDDDGGVGTASAEAQVQNLPPSLDMIAPSSVNEGEDFVLGITATDPGSDDLIISINWGDGTSDTETFYNNGIGPDPPNSGEGVYPFTVYSNLTHTYGDNGGFTIQVTVEDDDGGSVQEIVTTDVLNLPPQIGLPTTPLIFEEGEDFSLTATATDRGSDDLEFSWTFELGPSLTSLYYNDGTGPDPPLSPWGTFPFSAEDTVTHAYGDNGLYEVTITVSDDDGGSSASTLTIEVVNVEPSVDIGGPYAGDESSPIGFTATARDPGSDDLTLLWDWGDGTTDAIAFYNDGISADPPKSPWGTYPFAATHTISHVWGDNGDFTVTLTVMDDDGGVVVEQTAVTVNNVAPTIEGGIEYYLNASFAFRIAGEKWHNVEIYLYEDGTEVGYASITRYPGSPNEQMADFGEFSIDFSKTYSAVAYYTPEDDPINGQIWGATPAWVILDYEDGEERIHHTFNVRHEDTWTWVIEDFSPYFLGHNITFIATASDAGSDDLTFTWDWGDGNTTENVYYNDGVGPDPYPSPEVNPITVTDTVQYSFATSGTHTITLTVTDDDGGTETLVLVLSL
ncbi:MAG: PKD domain-containing protein [Thermoplasmata archaeon]|nr:PKD domain-containing protein [Thermoplasmata archaeon]